MTLFVAYNLDADGMAEKRQELLAAHRDYMKSLGEKVLWGGPLLAADGQTKRGGMYVFRASDTAEAQQITRNDPFVKGQIYQSCDTSVWRWQSGPDTVAKEPA